MFLRFNLITFLWAGIIFLLILTPGQEMPEMGDLFSFDKLAHLGVFGILSFFMILGFSNISLNGFKAGSSTDGLAPNL